MADGTDPYSRAEAKFRFLRDGGRFCLRALQLALVFWGTWSVQGIASDEGKRRWVLHWEPSRLLPSLLSSAAAWSVAALFLKAERALRRRGEDPGLGPEDRHWLQAATWSLQTLRQACTLIGALQLSQLATLEQLARDPYCAKAVLLGVLIWQALARAWMWVLPATED